MKAHRAASFQRRIEETLGVPDTGPIPATIYAGASKDSMFEKGEDLGLRGEALSAFGYTAGEVELSVRVDRESGRALLVGVNGVHLHSPDAMGGIPV